MPATDSAASDARAAAAHVVAGVLRDHRFVDRALADLRREVPDTSHQGLVQELSYGTLRWYHELAGIAALFLERPLKQKDADVHALLLIGLYQLRHTRIPAHAAVDTTVSAAAAMNKPWSKRLLNGCLRAALRNPERIRQALAASEVMRHSHPPWLIAAARRDYPDAWERILDANNQRPPMTLRVNAARIPRATYLARLGANGIGADAHPEVDSAVVLHRALAVDDLPGFEEGLVSVQDAAAQLAAAWLDVQPNQRVLDACAAPGGKAAHILERTPALQELTAVDIDPGRMGRVNENLTRLGLSARLIVDDAARTDHWWDGRPFDRILVDAPCSGTGVIRRHPDIKSRRRPEEMPKLLQTQAQILDGVWPSLASGGKLLYGTCSILAEENELQVRRFLARHPDAAAQIRSPGAVSIGRQILTGECGMDGFYYASVRKI